MIPTTRTRGCVKIATQKERNATVNATAANLSNLDKLPPQCRYHLAGTTLPQSPPPCKSARLFLRVGLTRIRRDALEHEELRRLELEHGGNQTAIVSDDHALIDR